MSARGWHEDPEQDGPRAASPAGQEGGRCRDTDPLCAGPSGGLRLRPVGLSEAPSRAAYEARTVDRHAALQQLAEGCAWHLLAIEIRNPHARELVVARRELYLRLQRSQREDDLKMTKLEQQEMKNGAY